MAIPIICGSCGKKMEAPDEYAGRKGQCGNCGAKFLVPVPKGMSPAPSVKAATPPKPRASAPPPLPPESPSPALSELFDDEDDLFGSSAPSRQRSRTSALLEEEEEVESSLDNSRDFSRSERSRDGRRPKKKKRRRSSGGFKIPVGLIVKLLLAFIVLPFVGLVGIRFFQIMNPNPSTWTSYRSPHGDFTIKLPKSPETETGLSPLGSIKQTMTALDRHIGVMVDSESLTRLHPRTEEQAAGLLKLYATFLVPSLEATLIEKKTNLHVYNRWPAIQIRCESSKMIVNKTTNQNLTREADILIFTNGEDLFSIAIIYPGVRGRNDSLKIHQNPSLVFETFQHMRGDIKLKIGADHDQSAETAWLESRGRTLSPFTRSFGEFGPHSPFDASSEIPKIPEPAAPPSNFPGPIEPPPGFPGSIEPPPGFPDSIDLPPGFPDSIDLPPGFPGSIGPQGPNDRSMFPGSQFNPGSRRARRR